MDAVLGNLLLREGQSPLVQPLLTFVRNRTFPADLPILSQQLRELVSVKGNNPKLGFYFERMFMFPAKVQGGGHWEWGVFLSRAILESPGTSAFARETVADFIRLSLVAQLGMTSFGVEHGEPLDGAIAEPTADFYANLTPEQMELVAWSAGTLWTLLRDPSLHVGRAAAFAVAQNPLVAFKLSADIELGLKLTESGGGSLHPRLSELRDILGTEFLACSRALLPPPSPAPRRSSP